jgi:putative ABC transport system permease protein
MIPYTTMQKRLMRITYLQSIVVRAVSAEKVAEAEEQITLLLRQRHRIAEGREDDFTVRNLSDIAEAAQSTARVMAILLGSVAGISLLVGGIGIMNIMLVSVTERTREIGIRMAVGARSKDIMLQFLVEAVVMAATGGIIGILLGIGSSELLKNLGAMADIDRSSRCRYRVSLSGAVGVFFGFYPAKKAAGLDPIDALRYE